MNLNKYVIAFLLVFFAFNCSYAQTTRFKEVHVGDTIPNIVLSGFLNDTFQNVALSELRRHKILLLDFWATWCAPCISELGRLDTIKQEFGNKIAVIAVGYQDYNTINKFFTLNPLLKPQRYPVLTHESILTRQMFPHKTIPHLVWIDTAGKVIAITQGADVTKDNINKLLKTGSLVIRVKKDIANFNINLPFHLRDSTYTARSIFTNITNGIPSFEAYGFSDPYIPDWINRIFIGNCQIRDMYLLAAYQGKVCRTNFSRMILEVKDSLKYMQPDYAPVSFKKSKYYHSPNSDDWDQDNLYCYELTLPRFEHASVLYNYMLEDLNRFLNLNGRFEKRKVKCYLLVCKHPALKHSVQNPQIIYKRGNPVILKGQTIDKVTEVLNNCIDDGQIVNETRIKADQLYDFDLPDLKAGISADEIRALLQPFGIEMKEGFRNVSVFVLSEKQ